MCPICKSQLRNGKIIYNEDGSVKAIEKICVNKSFFQPTPGGVGEHKECPNYSKVVTTIIK